MTLLIAACGNGSVTLKLMGADHGALIGQGIT
jgi:hypothetical protein